MFDHWHSSGVNLCGFVCCSPAVCALSSILMSSSSDSSEMISFFTDEGGMKGFISNCFLLLGVLPTVTSEVPTGVTGVASVAGVRCSECLVLSDSDGEGNGDTDLFWVFQKLLCDWRIDIFLTQLDLIKTWSITLSHLLLLILCWSDWISW